MPRACAQMGMARLQGPLLLSLLIALGKAALRSVADYERNELQHIPATCNDRRSLSLYPSSSAPALVVAVSSPLLYGGLLGDLILEPCLDQELPQPSVLGLQLFEALASEKACLRHNSATDMSAEGYELFFCESLLCHAGVGSIARHCLRSDAHRSTFGYFCCHFATAFE